MKRNRRQARLRDEGENEESVGCWGNDEDAGRRKRMKRVLGHRSNDEDGGMKRQKQKRMKNKSGVKIG